MYSGHYDNFEVESSYLKSARHSSTRGHHDFDAVVGWVFLAFTTAKTGAQTTVKATLNKDLLMTNVASGDFFQDHQDYQHSAFQLYIGFVYSYFVANTALTDAAVQAMVVEQTGPPKCWHPTGRATCLPTCTFEEYVEANGTTCSKCPLAPFACSYVCNKKDSCNLCNDLLCHTCSTPAPGSCTKCITNASFNPSQICECNTNFIRSTKHTCLPCAAPCTKCSAETGDCTACDSKNKLSAGKCVPCETWCIECLDDGRCTSCAPGYYIDLASKCLKCEATCATCKSLAECTDCAPGLQLQNGTCVKCQDTCAVCETSGCTACADGNVLQSGKCGKTCDTQFTLDPEGQTCVACETGCIECRFSSAGEMTCVQCQADVYRLSAGKCVCIDGTYEDSRTKRCEACPTNCTKCSTFDVCLACVKTEVLVDATCRPCDSFPGYASPTVTDFSTTATASQIQANPGLVCAEICGDGLNMGESQCDDGNIESGDGCSGTCEIESSFICSGGSPTSPDICKDENPPTFTLTLTDTTATEITLQCEFSEAVSGNPDDKAKLDIDGISSSNWSMSVSLVTTNPDKTTLSITVKPIVNILSGTEATLSFSDREEIVDVSGNSVEQKSDSVKLDEFTVSVGEEVVAAAAPAVQGTTATVGGANAASSAFSGGGDFTALWGLVELMQFLNFFGYMSIDHPAILRAFFSALGFANASFLPNIFELTDQPDDFSEPPGQFRQDGSTAFLLNTGSMLMIYFLLLFLFPLSLALFKLGPDITIFKSFRNMFFYSAWLRIGIESFLEITLGIFLQFRDMNAGSDFGVACIAMTFVWIAYFVLTTALVVKVVILPSPEVLGSEIHLRKFGTFYESFQQHSRVRRSFLLVQNFRRLLFVLVLVYLQDEPGTQAVFVAIFWLLYFVALLILRPYKEKYLGNGLQIFSEGVSALCTFLFLGFHEDSDLDNDQKEALGLVCMSLFCFVLLVNIVLLLIVQCVELARSIQKWCKKSDGAVTRIVNVFRVRRGESHSYKEKYGNKRIEPADDFTLETQFNHNDTIIGQKTIDHSIDESLGPPLAPEEIPPTINIPKVRQKRVRPAN